MFKIKIHSVVDVITNSSTTIYTMAGEGTIKAVRSLINELLKIGRSGLLADDLFEFSLTYDEDKVSDWRMEQLDDTLPDDDRWHKADWRERARILASYEANHLEWWNNYEPGEYDNYESVYLTVTAKDSAREDAAKMLSSLDSIFDHEGEYNG